MGWFYWICSTLNQKLKWNLGVHFGFVEHKNTLFPLSNFDIFSHYCDLFVCLFVCLFVSFFVDTTLKENLLYSTSTVLFDVQLSQGMFMNCAYAKYLFPLWLDLLTTYCWSLEFSHCSSSRSILKLLFLVILYFIFVFVFHEMHAVALSSHGVRDT